MTLDLVQYPVTARIVVVCVFGFVGWMMSKTGMRRWRSGVSLKETGAAMRSSRWFGPDYRPWQLAAIVLVYLAVGVYLALPELFGL